MILLTAPFDCSLKTPDATYEVFTHIDGNNAILTTIMSKTDLPTEYYSHTVLSNGMVITSDGFNQQEPGTVTYPPIGKRLLIWSNDADKNLEIQSEIAGEV
jgi:hypothetical protein